MKILLFLGILAFISGLSTSAFSNNHERVLKYCPENENQTSFDLSLRYDSKNKKFLEIQWFEKNGQAQNVITGLDSSNPDKLRKRLLEGVARGECITVTQTVYCNPNIDSIAFPVSHPFIDVRCKYTKSIGRLEKQTAPSLNKVPKAPPARAS